MTSNLPAWNGAFVVYSRALAIVEHLNRAAYAAQRKAARGKKFRFVPNGDAQAIVRAMDGGDEEVLKAATFQHMHIWGDCAQGGLL
jgi:hypothetical protein